MSNIDELDFNKLIAGLPEEEQKKIKKFVEDENKDRAAVVKEVVAFNKMNERHKGILIKSIFEVYKNSSIKGSFYYQNKTWQKHF